MSEATSELYSWRASIIKKQLMALTGLMMCGFLLVHLAGNLLLLKGSDVFNQFAYLMVNNPIIIGLEWLLLLVFLMHTTIGFRLILENQRARTKAYAVRSTVARGSKFAFISMSVTGPLMMVFIIVHLFDLKFGSEYLVVQSDLEVRDLYRTVVEFYSSEVNVAIYIAAMCATALHVQHGFWSAFQTFGLSHARYNRLVELSSDVFALVILIGFGMIPIYFLLGYS